MIGWERELLQNKTKLTGPSMRQETLLIVSSYRAVMSGIISANLTNFLRIYLLILMRYIRIKVGQIGVIGSELALLLLINEHIAPSKRREILPVVLSYQVAINGESL